MSQNTITAGLDSSGQLGVAAAVMAALRTGLLAELTTKAPATTSELASRLGLNPRALALVLEVLTTMHVIRAESDGRYAPGEALAASARAPGGIAFHIAMWGHVEGFLRTGEPFMVMDQAPDQREQAYTNVVAGLGTMFEDFARDVAARLPVTPARILDVGCGSGVWSLAIAERHPGARVTGLDLPAVLANFSARAASLSLAERVDTLPGDMHAVALPAAAYDLAVIANVLRIDTPDDAARVVERVGKAVAPGGKLLVIDALAAGTPDRERGRALYALHLGLRTRSGEVHHPDTISRWLGQAGFSRIEAIDVGNGAGGIGGLLATK